MRNLEKITLLIIMTLGFGFQFFQFQSPIYPEISPVAAAPDIPTVTTIHPNRSVVWTGDVLELTVHVTTEGAQGIETGLVTISDLNDSWSQDYALQTNSNGKLVVSRSIATVTIEGKHVYQAVYQGDVPSGYLGSSGATIVEFLSAEPSGVEPCNVTVELDGGIVFANESFTITVNVTALGASPPPFYGGNIAIMALAEEIVLESYIIPSGFYFDLSIIFSVPIPLWFSPGMTDLTANFTDTKGNFFPAFRVFMIDILDAGHQLAVTVTPDPINRVDDQVTIRVDFAGDNATGKMIRVGWTDEATNWTITTRTVASDPEIILWSVSYTFAPGPYRVWVELYNPQTQYVYSSADQAVTLYDYVDLDWQMNTTDLAPGDTVSFHFECQQQDVVLAIPSRILITDSEEGLIGNVTTDSLGVTDFIWNIPADTPGGSHSLNVTVVPLDSGAGIVQQTFWIGITIKGRTELQLTYPAQIQRGDTLDVAYQLSVDNNDPVTEGQIYFTPPNDSLQIQDVDADGNGIFSLNISLNHPVGNQTFTVTYGGTGSYSMANETFNITVLSKPYFASLAVNASPVLPNQTLRVFGQLLDEVNQGVPEQSILFYLAGSIGLGTAITGADGSFAYNWIIPADATPGLNVISAEFLGNFSAGYLPPMNQPQSTQVLISNDIALEVPAITVAGTTEILKIHGGWGTEVSIFWQGNWSAEEHLLVADLPIPTSSVPYEVSWDVPLERGEVSFRIEDSLGRTRFASAGVYIDPQYVFPDPLESITLYIDQEYILNASCSDGSYRILVDDIPVTSWRTTNTSLPLSFNIRGIHTIAMEISGSYILAKTIEVDITVYEPVTVNILVPSNVTANSSVTIEITVTSGLPGGQPLSGKDVSVELYDLTRFSSIAVYSASLDVEGKRIIQTEPLSRGTYEVQVQVLAGQDWFDPKSESVIFYVVGQAYLQFVPPDSVVYNESVNLAVTLHDDEGPVSEKIIALWWMQGENGWNLLGENTTAATGKAFFVWKPVLEPGDDYRLKAELVNPLDLGNTAVIKPVRVLAIPPTILSVHSLLNQKDAGIIGPGEYEVVALVQENSPFSYAVYLTVNDQRTNLSRVDGTEYLFQDINQSYWISSNGNVLYVGTISLLGTGAYNISVEAEDVFSTKSIVNLGVFSIVPPSVIEVFSLLPEGNETSIVSDNNYTVVAQVQENSPMGYSVYLVINGEKILMAQHQGDGYTLLAPNGTKYFIPANGDVLFSGTISFPSNGTYEIEIMIEDEFGSVETWKVGAFLFLPSESKETKTSEDNPNSPNDANRGGVDVFSGETILIVTIMGISSGAVAFVGRPRGNKI
ncbi:MAG: hypothetical protein ACXACI_13440 [Candidatus Hodarchaeales archaeon]